MAPNTFDDQEDDRQLWNWLTGSGTTDPVTTPPKVTTSATSALTGSDTPSDAKANPTTDVPTTAFGMVWNGATWDRAPGTAAAGTKVDTELPAAGALTADGIAAPTAPIVGVFPYTMDRAATWSRLIDPGNSVDGTEAKGALTAGGLAYNGTGNNWDRLRTASATNIAANSGLGAGLVAKPGNWAVTHLPATATKATISQGAGATGVRHVCTSVSFTYAGGASAVAAAAPMTVSLRDGASGAGTVLQSWYINVPAVAGESRTVTLTDLSIEGSAATAMTLEYAAAGGTNSYESVAMTGYDVS